MRGGRSSTNERRYRLSLLSFIFRGTPPRNTSGGGGDARSVNSKRTLFYSGISCRLKLPIWKSYAAFSSHTARTSELQTPTVPPPSRPQYTTGGAWLGKMPTVQQVNVHEERNRNATMAEQQGVEGRRPKKKKMRYAAASLASKRRPSICAPRGILTAIASTVPRVAQVERAHM